MGQGVFKGEEDYLGTTTQCALKLVRNLKNNHSDFSRNSLDIPTRRHIMLSAFGFMKASGRVVVT